MSGARVLLSGKPEMTDSVRAALRAAGAEPFLHDMGVGPAEGGPFAAYIQLPVTVKASGWSDWISRAAETSTSGPHSTGS